MAIRKPVSFDSDYEREFKPIPSLLNGKYEINDNGTVLRNSNTKKEISIRLEMHHAKDGYYRSSIHIGGRKPGNKVKHISIHRAVADAFIGPCPDGYEVDHIDRNSKNNDISNLRYVTKSEQMKNRDHTNIAARGSINLENARRERAKSILLYNDDEELNFDSIAECSRFLSNKFNVSPEKARYRVRSSNTSMYGYNIKYT